MNGKNPIGRNGTSVLLLATPTGVEQAIALARTARDDGADGVALELNKFPVELRTVENFRRIVSSVQLPFMFNDYRSDIYFGGDDEARMGTLLKAAEAGADLIDVIGDLYAPAPFELATDERAIARQKEAIAEVHARGAQVIMSSHVLDRSRTADECLAHLRMQKERGADIVKLVTMAYTRADFLEGVRTMMRLNDEMKTPWIFLNGGPYARMQRMMGPHFGCAVEFAVHDYMNADYYDQPTVANFKKAAAAIAWRLPAAD